MKQTPLKRKKGLNRRAPAKKNGKPKPSTKKPSKLQQRKADVHSKYWLTRADAAWSRYVRLRDRGCAVCGTPEYIQAHHLIRRSCYFFRHNPENGLTLCPQHHEYSNDLSAHGAPWAFDEWLQNARPETWEWFAKNLRTVIRGVKIDYKAICEQLTEMADRLEDK